MSERPPAIQSTTGLIGFWAIMILAWRGIMEWLGPNGRANLYREFVADWVEFWDFYKDQLTPDFDHPAWWAIALIIGAFAIFRLPRFAKMGAIGVLAFVLADVAAWIVGWQTVYWPGIDITLWAMIASGWLLLARGLTSARF